MDIRILVANYIDRSFSKRLCLTQTSDNLVKNIARLRITEKIPSIELFFRENTKYLSHTNKVIYSFLRKRKHRDWINDKIKKAPSNDSYFLS